MDEREREPRHEDEQGTKGPAALWGGGFREPMHPALQDLSVSLDQDLPLADADLRASAAYARALELCGVLNADETLAIARAIETMRSDLSRGLWSPAGAEDIHAAIEEELSRRIGELAGRLHTGRSRNDQVATAFRMAVREQAAGIEAAIRGLQRALLRRAEQETDTLLPAYTHLQRAQPVRLAHWLLAHFWPLERDAARIRAAMASAGVLPLGSGAATGHPFQLDRERLAKELGFEAVSANSLDAVGDRDFAVEFAFACALSAVHLSRLAEELVTWSTVEFGFVHWPDSLATGSSLMPNKKNPDLAELVRGRAATAVGDLMSLLVLLKGLAGGYQRDLQEGQPPVWRCARSLRTCIAAMTAGIERIEFDRISMQNALTDEVLATEAADALVARGIPFRRAHAAVSRLVADARGAGRGFRQWSLEADHALPAPITRGDLENLDAERAVERRTSTGGTSRSALIRQIEAARETVRERS